MIAFDGLKSVRRVLCLGAHSDDIEIGAGATLLRILKCSPSVEVHYAMFSGNPQRHEEAQTAADLLLGSGRVRCHFHSFADTRFPSQIDAIKDAFEPLRGIDPDLVLTHARDDRHQDHRVINQLTWNTFRANQVWEYEIPKWDGDLTQPNLYVNVGDAELDQKIAVLMSVFASQRSKHWFDAETFRGLARIRGLESNSKYAEGFIARKVVIGL